MEKYFVWKVLTDVEGGKTKRLITPWGNPMLYEYPFDYMFETEQTAVQGLIDFGAIKDAKNESWLLCVETISPLKRQPILPPSEELQMITAEEANRNVLIKRAEEICDDIGRSINAISLNGEKKLQIEAHDYVSDLSSVPREFILHRVRDTLVSVGYCVSYDLVLGKWEVGW